MVTRVIHRLTLAETATRTIALNRTSYVEATSTTPKINATLTMAGLGVSSNIVGPPGVQFSGTLAGLSQTITYHSATAATPLTRVLQRVTYVDALGGASRVLYDGSVAEPVVAGGGPVTMNASLGLATIGLVSFTGAQSNFNLSNDSDFAITLAGLGVATATANPLKVNATNTLAGLGFASSATASGGVNLSATLAGLGAFIQGTTTGSANITMPQATLAGLGLSSQMTRNVGVNLSDTLDPLTFTSLIAVAPDLNLNLSVTFDALTNAPPSVVSGQWTIVPKAQASWLSL